MSKNNKKVLILHGWGGSDYPHWQAWLASELIKKNFCVSFPEIKDKEFPNFKQWLTFLQKEFEHFQPDFVVCHSLANILWFHFVEKFDIQPIEKLMLVAPVRKNCTIKELETFFPYPIPKDLKAKEIIMAGSSNDPYMSVEEIIELQSELNIGLKILDDAGHINTDSCYGELPCALEWLTKDEESNT